MLGSIHERALNSLLGRQLTERLFFMHVPKCGGTSIDRAIKSFYKLLDVRRGNEIVRVDSKFSARVSSLYDGYDYTHGCVDDYSLLCLRVKLLAYQFYIKRNRYISGHVPFSRVLWETFGDEIAFITVLRDPLKKWLSNYYFRKYRESDRWIIDEELEEYLDSDRGRMHGYDYVKYYGGAREAGDYTSAEAIQEAKENLKRFNLVGVLENLDAFTKEFKKQFGRTLNVRHHNRSPVRTPESSELKSSVEQEIRRVCAPDIEIYQYVKEQIIGNAEDAYSSR